MAGQGQVNGDLLVPGQRGAAHTSIPLRAAMARGHNQWAPDLQPEGLQLIQEFWVMPVLPAAEPSFAPTGQFAHAEIWPAPLGFEGRNRMGSRGI